MSDSNKLEDKIEKLRELRNEEARRDAEVRRDVGLMMATLAMIFVEERLRKVCPEEDFLNLSKGLDVDKRAHCKRVRERAIEMMGGLKQIEYQSDVAPGRLLEPLKHVVGLLDIYEQSFEEYGDGDG